MLFGCTVESNMYSGTLWTATWDAAKKGFNVAQAFDFESVKAGVPHEIYVVSKNSIVLLPEWNDMAGH